MENIKVHGSGKHADESIEYYATEENTLNNYDTYEAFIKGCEHAVRKDDRYIAYIAKLKSNGLNFCAVLGNLKEDDKVKLEMHHGPIFNLFDICDIVARAMFKRGIEKITTFQVAKHVLEEHELDNIMIVMLSKSPHRGGHFNLFINIKSTVGRIERFIDRWSDGMVSEHWDYLERYLNECKKCKDTVDNGLFDTAKRLKKFK